MVAKIIGLIFGALGAVALLLTLVFVVTTLTFISQASTADGTVTSVQRAGKGYNADINFTTSDGRPVQFTSPIQSNPPEFSVGQQVHVYYNLDNPSGSARPDSFLSMWFWSGLTGIFAVVFGGIGLAFFLVYFLNERKIKWLQRNGQRVVGVVSQVQLNKSVRNMGKSPYVVWVHWRNPGNGRTYNFKSNNIWLDPLPISSGNEISVLIDPQNIGRYYVDTSSLPVAKT